jgi:hypothetical protein
MTRLVLVLACVSCANRTTVPAARFANAPIVQAVNDRRDVSEQPEAHSYSRYLWNFDGQFFRRITRALELRRHERSRGINALGDVPSSTWFTNRIGIREISPAEIAAAPGGVGSPEPHRPWTIVSTKAGGTTVGFIIKDARGEKFLLKFDLRGFPEAETGAHVIVGKLLWAFGYNVTEDYVVFLKREDLVIARDAVAIDTFGSKRHLGRDEVERKLQTVDVARDGTMRALASHWLPGVPIGGHKPVGVRDDDPNDLIPHELRRDLRGMYVVFSWLDHTDVHGGNTLDVYVTDPEDPHRHYVKHYFLDFGIGLGVGAAKMHEPRLGYEHYLDFGDLARSLLTLGIANRSWEQRREQAPRGVGLLDVENFDPGKWVSSSPAYAPLYAGDRFDKFWAAKIVARFTPAQIRAAVDSARLSDPSAAAWLTEALIARQRKLVRHWFERVNPLDAFTVADGTLCFDDLAIAHGLASAERTRYAIRFHDRAGRRTGFLGLAANAGATNCSPLQLSRSDSEGYTIVRIATKRPRVRGATYVHLARDPATRLPRVIGVWRT